MGSPEGKNKKRGYRKSFGILSMCLGTVLLVAAVSLFLFNRQTDRRAGAHAGEVLQQLENQWKEQRKKEQTPQNQEGQKTSAKMEGYELDGREYIGYLQIEALELQLPVQADWSYPKLKETPCRYAGAVGTGDLVIFAHNYRSHFGEIDRLSEGDTVFFTDINGKEYRYAVAEVEVLDAAAVEDMTAGEYDLTLFTCTYSGKSRVAVRCDRSKGEDLYDR